MGKIKDNIIRRYLPMWAKETVFAENRTLQKKIARLEQENNRLRAYIDGIKLGAKVRADSENL